MIHRQTPKKTSRKGSYEIIPLDVDVVVEDVASKGRKATSDKAPVHDDDVESSEYEPAVVVMS